MNRDDWIGREERVSDLLTSAFARRWLATFDRDPSGTGWPLPQGIHWCLCTPETPTMALGPDGHPLRDVGPTSLLPPVPQPRRMWAGSKVGFHAPIKAGAALERISSVVSIEHKQGGSGELVFVTVRHDFWADGISAVSEEQTLVYRDPPPPGSPVAPPLPGVGHFDPSGWDEVESFLPSPQLLFRYSALTFNTHRIHYDADYVREVEGYRGLVVHGPLMASLLLQLAARRFGENALASFAFRGVGPAIAGEELVLALRGTGGTIELGVFATDGREVMRAFAALQGA